jgi:glycerol kinase
LDSIGFQTSSLVECIQKDAKTTIKEIRVDGGMVDNENFIQSLANILQIKIIQTYFLSCYVKIHQDSPKQK